jgi:transcriptional regulator with XRE-family HTH domain
MVEEIRLLVVRKMDDHMAFSDNLRKARKKKGLSQKEVAEKLGIDQTTYSTYETGTRIAGVDKVPELLAILDISADDLFDWVDLSDPDKALLRELNTKIQDLPDEALDKLFDYIGLLQLREKKQTK